MAVIRVEGVAQTRFVNCREAQKATVNRLGNCPLKLSTDYLGLND